MRTKSGIRTRLAVGFAVVLLPALLAGCDAPAGGPVTAAPQAPQAPVAPGQAAPMPPVVAEPAVERVEAGVGVGIKGRRLDQDHVVDAIAQPAKTYFAARERVVFEIQVPHTLSLYKATEGRGPRTHEEFMQKIIRDGAINLPELPPGHNYVYDPATEELMVERPATPAAP